MVKDVETYDEVYDKVRKKPKISPSETFSPRLWTVVPPKGRKSKIDPSDETMVEFLKV